MNDIAEYAVKVLHEYAYKTTGLVRSTSDISPLEEWLIIKLYQLTGGEGYKRDGEGPEEWEVLWKKTFEEPAEALQESEASTENWCPDWKYDPDDELRWKG